MQSDKRLKRYYNLINKKFFNNELPHNVCVRYVNEDDKDEDYNCEEKYYGWLSEPEDNRHKWTIIISKPKNPGRTALLNTLAMRWFMLQRTNVTTTVQHFRNGMKSLLRGDCLGRAQCSEGLTLF